MALELIPIGTILALLSNQVLKTANAANNVLFEKESFNVLSKHLFDIEPVLNELQRKKLDDSQAARIALSSLESDVRKANSLVEKYKNCARFYLLLKCRHIVKEVEDVTRGIGRSLAVLSLANTEVLSGISDQVNRLQSEMQRVEFEASQSQRQIVDKLNEGLKEQKHDQGFANSMLEEIARAVGVPVEPSEISKELASVRRDKEEAASRKELAEVLFLEQVIGLLLQADAARDHEEMKKQYLQRVQCIQRFDEMEEYIPPFNSFICPISRTIMTDPVSLSTNTTCERVEIEASFSRGDKIDPETGDILEDLSLRANLPLRQSIQEWRELNYCLKIRSSKAKLLSGDDADMVVALGQMRDLIRENSINKDWITIAGLTHLILSILESTHNNGVRKEILLTLKDIVQGHARNKDEVAESQGLDHLVPCLGRDPSISKPAVELLYELFLDRSGLNVSAFRKISQQSSAIICLVALLNGPVEESAEKAEEILTKLCDEDENNILIAARAGWYKPLLDCIIKGPESSRFSMVRTIVSMELTDRDMTELGEEGVIPALIEMTSGNLESKELSLSALVKLFGCRVNKELFTASNGLPSILKLMFSSHVRIISAKCFEILDKLSSHGDGVRFLVDENGRPLELDPIITRLLALEQDHSICRPALHALLELCKSEAGLAKKAVLSADGVSHILPLLDDSNREIREIAINLLFLFSQHEPQGVVEYLFMPRRLEAIVGYLESGGRVDTQIAAAGLLANLPKSEVLLTKRLIELGGLEAIINILKSGTMEAKENALSALFRFTDPTDLASQRNVVSLGAYPLLVNLMQTGSEAAKARAAALTGNLSLSSPKLATTLKPSGCWCFWRAHASICPAHGIICSVDTTFCLLKAGALLELVTLLHVQVHATAYEAIQALSTLVLEESPRRGASVLHDAGAINPILEVLTWGTDSLQEEALKLLEKLFTVREMVECYGPKGRILLVGVTARNMQADGHFGRNTARVLSLIERYSRSSTSMRMALGRSEATQSR